MSNSPGTRMFRAARLAGHPVMLAFGAHTIKNGLAPVLIELIEQGWVTLLATNGAGIIHDWEFASQGLSSEVARARGLKVLGLTGEGGGRLAELCDLCIRVPAKRTLEVQELHLPIYHTLCLLIEDECFSC